MTVTVRRAEAADAGELWTVQRAAFVGEALKYGEFLPPLLEPLESIVAAIADRFCVVVAALDGTRIVGGGRLHIDADVGRIGRLCVVPDRQGSGIGARMIETLEQSAPEEVVRFEMFTGDLSVENLGLYAKLGYVESGRRGAGTHQLVDLAKLRTSR